MSKFFLILTSIIIVSLINAGELYSQSTIEETPNVKVLMENFIKIGKEEPYIDGWRVKLISTTDRRALENARWLFENRYPDMVYSLSHEAPYYSMKVGAYENRFDVEPHLVSFKEDFPLAIPFRDKIMKTELFEENGY